MQTTAAAATNGDAGFAFSPLLTPFFMGTVIGAIATGQIPADASHTSLRLGRLGHSPPPAPNWRGHAPPSVRINIFCGDWESHGQYGSGPGRAVKGHGAAYGLDPVAQADQARAAGGVGAADAIITHLDG